MQELVQFLRDRSTDGLLPLTAQIEAAGRYGLSVARVEEVALTANILPARYQRNREMISLPQQLALFRSRVAVVGCGGLGGYIIEELARLGIGGIVAIDPDVFQEHNLNRQLYSAPDQLGRKKVEAAACRVAAVNPAVTFRPVAEAFAEQNGDELLRGVAVAVDALDSIPARLLLAEMCDIRGIPMVHGAIAGWYGRLATQFPGDGTLQRLYPGNRELPGIEAKQGNPSFTPAVVAALEVAEVVKILLHIGEPIRNRCLSIDLFHLEFDEIPLREDQTRIHENHNRIMKANKPAVIRMFGLLHTLRTKQGLPVTVEHAVPPEGKAAREIALELHLPLEKIEAVFCNHIVYALDHLIMPGDRVAFVPYGTPGPHRYCLGIKQAGDRSR